MNIIKPEIVKLHRDFWNGVNNSTLFCLTYPKRQAAAGGYIKYIEPWMEDNIDWIYARSVIHAHKTRDISAVNGALDILECELEQREFAGAAYPTINLNTGAGCLAACITEYARFYSGTVWFELDQAMEYEKICSLPADFTTPFMETTLKAVEMTAKRFAGKAILTTLDIGGLADILSSLRRTDGFLFDMVDRPNDVKAALWVIRGIWKTFYDRMQTLIDEANSGLYSSWTGPLAEHRYYPSQCDACALISPGMFDEFVWPTLSDEFAEFEKTLYHLDGSGEIPHLETLCSHPSLRLIQWVPEPAVSHHDDSYHPMYRKVIGFGRKLVFNGFKGSDSELKQFLSGFPNGAFMISLSADSYDEAMRKREFLGF